MSSTPISTDQDVEPDSRWTTRKRLVVLVVAVLLLACAGVAFAAYLSDAEGNGSSTSSVAVNSTISAGNGGTQLFPGATTSYTVTINNPNPYPAKVVSISGSTSTATGSGACPAGTVTSSGLSNPGGTIAPKSSASYSLTANMIADPANACQGQSFTMPLTAQLASAAG